jgi:hypothetical protein
MKAIIATVLLSFIFNLIIHSQDCKNNFANTVSQNYSNNQNRFEKIVAKSLKDQKCTLPEGYRIINIPVIVFDGKAKGNQVDSVHNIFFCLLCDQTIEFDETFIFIDTLFYGIVNRCPTKDCKVKFIKGSEPYGVYLTPLAKKLNEIKPEVVFRIYNLPNVYWYLKKKEFYALSFKLSNEGYGTMTNFQIIKPEAFINSVDENNLFLLLSLKKVNIIR